MTEKKSKLFFNLLILQMGNNKGWRIFNVGMKSALEECTGLEISSKTNYQQQSENSEPYKVNYLVCVFLRPKIAILRHFHSSRGYKDAQS